MKYNRRQDAPKVYSISTICFILKPNFVLNTSDIFKGKVTTALFDKKYSIDIDDNYDFEIAKTLFKKINNLIMTILLPIEIKVREFHSKIFSFKTTRGDKF